MNAKKETLFVLNKNFALYFLLASVLVRVPVGVKYKTVRQKWRAAVKRADDDERIRYRSQRMLMKIKKAKRKKEEKRKNSRKKKKRLSAHGGGGGSGGGALIAMIVFSFLNLDSSINIF